MTTQPLFAVSKTTSELTDGLTAGASYVAQNRGSQTIEYTTYPTDPTEENVGWLVVVPGDHIQFTVDAADPVWVRCAEGASAMVITDA